MTDLYRLLYTSFIAPDFDSAELPHLVRRARQNNIGLDITGLLIFDGICFCAYLEGPAAALESLLPLLRADLRHIEFSVREHVPLSGARLFPQSPLACALCDDPDALDSLRNSNPTKGMSAMALFERLLPVLNIERGI